MRQELPMLFIPMPLISHLTRVVPIALLLAMAMPAACPAHAADAVFDHENWQLVCDNTRTCRAAMPICR
jgi:hypothetical protein